MNLWIGIVVDPGKISASIVWNYTFNSVKQYIVKNMQVKNKKNVKMQSVASLQNFVFLS